MRPTTHMLRVLLLVAASILIAAPLAARADADAPSAFCVRSTIQIDAAAGETAATGKLDFAEAFPAFLHERPPDNGDAGDTRLLTLTQRLEVSVKNFEDAAAEPHIHGIALPDIIANFIGNPRADGRQPCHDLNMHCEPDTILIPYISSSEEADQENDGVAIFRGPAIRAALNNIIEAASQDKHTPDQPNDQPNDQTAKRPDLDARLDVFADYNPTSRQAEALQRLAGMLQNATPFHQYFTSRFPYPKLAVLHLKQVEVDPNNENGDDGEDTPSGEDGKDAPNGDDGEDTPSGEDGKDAPNGDDSSGEDGENEENAEHPIIKTYVTRVSVIYDIKIVKRYIPAAAAARFAAPNGDASDTGATDDASIKLFSSWCPTDERLNAISDHALLPLPDLIHAENLVFHAPMTKPNAWNKLWLVHLMPQIYQSALLHADITPSDNNDFYPPAFFDELIDRANDNSIFWHTLQSEWILPHYNLAATSEFDTLIARSIEREGDSEAQDGKLIRVYDAHGSGQLNQPAARLRLSREAAARFVPLADTNGGDLFYATGWHTIGAWVIEGLHRYWEKSFIVNNNNTESETAAARAWAHADALPDPGRADDDDHDPDALVAGDAWSPWSWLAPKNLLLTLTDNDFLDIFARNDITAISGALRRLTNATGSLYFAPSSWPRVESYLRALVNSVKRGGALQDALKEAAQRLCADVRATDDPQQRRLPEFHFCAHPETGEHSRASARALYFGLSQIDHMPLFRLSRDGGGGEIEIAFETLGVIASNRADTGFFQKTVYPQTRGTPSASDFSATLFDRRDREQDLGLASLFSRVQRQTRLIAGPISHAFGHFYNQSSNFVHTQIDITHGTLNLIISPRSAISDAAPLHIPLPASCTDRSWLVERAGPETAPAFPTAVEHHDLSWTNGETRAFTSVACASGEILFFLDGRPLACDAEGRAWRMHEALYLKDAFNKQNVRPHGAITRDDIDNFVTRMMCRHSHEWDGRVTAARPKSFHAMINEELSPPLMDQLFNDGSSHIRFIRPTPDTSADSDQPAINVLIGMADGGIHSLNLTRQTSNTRNTPETWILRAPAHPEVFFGGDKGKTHFRTDITPTRRASLDAAPLSGIPVDAVESKGFSFADLIARLPQDARTRLAGVCGAPEHLTLRLTFVLSSRGTSMTELTHYLTKYITPAWKQTPVIPQLTGLKTCLGEIRGTLGHGQSVPLNLRLARRLRARFASAGALIPDIVVDGMANGGLTFFDAAQLGGLLVDAPTANGGAPSIMAWTAAWLKRLIAFVPNNYFFIGYQDRNTHALSRVWLSDRGSDGACFEVPHALTRDTANGGGGVLSQGFQRANSCEPLTRADDEAADAQALVNNHYVHSFFHTYEAAGLDDPTTTEPLVLVHDSARDIRHLSAMQEKEHRPDLTSDELAAHDNAPWREYIIGRLRDSERDGNVSNELTNLKSVFQSFAALTDPIEGQLNIVRFSLASHPLAAEEPALNRLQDVLEDEGTQADIEHSVQAYIAEAVKRYFCSFATVSLGIDALKVFPGEYDLAYTRVGGSIEAPQWWTHLYRDEALTIINGNSPFDCGDVLASYGEGDNDTNKMALTSPMVELKVSAADQWDAAYGEVEAIIGPYINEVTALRDSLDADAYLLSRLIRSSTLAPAWTTTLAEIKFPENTLNSGLNAENFGRLADQSARDGNTAPFAARLKSAVDSDGFADLIREWTQSLRGESKEEAERLMTAYLAHFVGQNILYTEYFGPALRFAYEKMFVQRLGETPVPTASSSDYRERFTRGHDALLDAVSFKNVSTPNLKNNLKAALLKQLEQFGINTETERRAAPLANALDKLKLCQVTNIQALKNDFSNIQIRCAEEKEGADATITMTPDARTFLKYFIGESLQVNNRFDTDEEGAVAAYAKHSIRAIYMLGARPNNEKSGEEEAVEAQSIVPLTFMVYHRRPYLSVLTEDKDLLYYADSKSGDRTNHAGLFGAYYNFAYLYDAQRQPNTRTANWLTSPVNYEPDFTLLPTDKERAFRFHATLPGTFEPSLRLPENAAHWSPLAVATWLASAPIKMNEFSHIRASSGACTVERLNREMDSDDINQSQVAALFRDCDSQYGIDLPDPDNPPPDNHTHQLNIEAREPYTSRRSPDSTSSWIMLSSAYQSLADIYFQSFWDRWITRERQKERVLPYAASPVFEAAHKSLFRFILPNAPYHDFSVTDQIIKKLIRPLYHRNNQAPDIKPYHDLLALETLFPMTRRYMWAPKFHAEFEGIESFEAECAAAASPLKALIDTDTHGALCLAARVKRKLIAAHEAPSYFYGPDALTRAIGNVWREPSHLRHSPFHVAPMASDMASNEAASGNGGTTEAMASDIARVSGLLIPRANYWIEGRTDGDDIRARKKSLKNDYDDFVHNVLFEDYTRRFSHWFKRPSRRPNGGDSAQDPVVLFDILGWLTRIVSGAFTPPTSPETPRMPKAIVETSEYLLNHKLAIIGESIGLNRIGSRSIQPHQKQPYFHGRDRLNSLLVFQNRGPEAEGIQGFGDSRNLRTSAALLGASYDGGAPLGALMPVYMPQAELTWDEAGDLNFQSFVGTRHVAQNFEYNAQTGRVEAPTDAGANAALPLARAVNFINQHENAPISVSVQSAASLGDGAYLIAMNILRSNENDRHASPALGQKALILKVTTGSDNGNGNDDDSNDDDSDVTVIWEHGNAQIAGAITHFEEKDVSYMCVQYLQYVYGEADPSGSRPRAAFFERACQPISPEDRHAAAALDIYRWMAESREE